MSTIGAVSGAANAIKPQSGAGQSQGADESKSKEELQVENKALKELVEGQQANAGGGGAGAINAKQAFNPAAGNNTIAFG